MEKRKPGRPKGSTGLRVARGFTDIARGAKEIAKTAEKDSDRLGAYRLLLDLRQMGNEATGPPAPDGAAETEEALARQLMAAGPAMTIRAVKRVWPAALITIAEAPSAVVDQQPVAQAQEHPPV